jgi:hypothetical protein
MLKYKTPTIAINDHEGRCLGQQACLYEQGEDDDDHDGDDDLYVYKQSRGYPNDVPHNC